MTLGSMQGKAPISVPVTVYPCRHTNSTTNAWYRWPDPGTVLMWKSREPILQDATLLHNNTTMNQLLHNNTTPLSIHVRCKIQVLLGDDDCTILSHVLFHCRKDPSS